MSGTAIVAIIVAVIILAWFVKVGVTVSWTGSDGKRRERHFGDKLDG